MPDTIQASPPSHFLPLLDDQFSSLGTRPENTILGLVFPQSTPSSSPSSSAPIAPRLVWIPHTQSTDDETSISFQSVDVTSHFPSDSSLKTDYSDYNVVKGRDSQSMLEIWLLDDDEVKDRKGEALRNECIASLSEDVRESHSWRGPVVILTMTRATGFAVDPGSYRDVSIVDCVDVLDYLVGYEPRRGEKVREELGRMEIKTGTEATDVETVKNEEGENDESKGVVFEVL